MNYQATRLAATEALNNALKDIPYTTRLFLVKLFQESFDDEFEQEMRLANHERELEEREDWQEELEHRRIERSRL